MLTFVTVASLVLLVGLYFWAISLRSSVIRLTDEVKERGRGEAQARRESIEAQAALITAFEELRREIKAARSLAGAEDVAARPEPGPAPANEPAAEGDRTTLEISRPPPGCDPEAGGSDADVEGDPTTVLSREATAAAILGIPYKRVARLESDEEQSLGPDDATPQAGVPVPEIPAGPNGSGGRAPEAIKDRPKKT